MFKRARQIAQQVNEIKKRSFFFNEVELFDEKRIFEIMTLSL